LFLILARRRDYSNDPFLCSTKQMRAESGKAAHRETGILLCMAHTRNKTSAPNYLLDMYR
jgi:hypothetical protein